MKSADASILELLEAIDMLRKAGWTVEPPTSKTGTKRRGRPPKKRVGRPPKAENLTT